MARGWPGVSSFGMRYENKNVRMGEILLLAVGRSDTGVP
jgi:hypothetical protein